MNSFIYAYAQNFLNKYGFLCKKNVILVLAFISISFLALNFSTALHHETVPIIFLIPLAIFFFLCVISIALNFKLSVLIVFLLFPLMYKIKLFPLVFVHPLFLLLIFSLLLQTILNKPSFKQTLNIISNSSLCKWYWLLTGLMILSTLYGMLRHQQNDIVNILKPISYFLCFLIFPSLFYLGSTIKREKMLTYIKYFTIPGFIVATYSLTRILINVLHGGNLEFYNYRPDTRALGFFGQYIDLTGIHMVPSGIHGVSGDYFALIGSLLFCLLLHQKKIKLFNNKIVLFIMLSIVVVATIFSFARTGVFILLIAILFQIVHGQSINKKLFLLFITLIISVSLLYLFNEHLFAKKILQLVMLTSDGLRFEGSFGLRILIWEQAINFFCNNPLYLFFGAGHSQYSAIGVLSESVFFGTLNDMGVFGVLVLLFFWFKIFKTISNAIKFCAINQLIEEKFLLIAFKGFFIGFTLDNFLSSGLFYTDVLIFGIWGLFGLILGNIYSHNIKREHLLT